VPVQAAAAGAGYMIARDDVALPGTARDVKGAESRFSVTPNLPGDVLPGPPPHPQGAKDEGGEEHDNADEQQEQQTLHDYADEPQRYRQDHQQQEKCNHPILLRCQYRPAHGGGLAPGHLPSSLALER
jgi:hypothetical protein